jgi:hypothetical protein
MITINQYITESNYNNFKTKKINIQYNGKLIKTIPYRIDLIIKEWDKYTPTSNIYSIEGPFDKEPNKDPEKYIFYKGKIKEGTGRPALKYVHTVDKDMGKRQANLYWHLLKKGYKILEIIETFGKHPKEWIAYYVLI